MRRQQTVIAGGAAVALAALGYRAWSRGVFAGATGAAYTPWDDWGGNDLDGTRRPLRAATLAASPHNTQPWLFDLTGDAIDVYADRARHLGSFDPLLFVVSQAVAAGMPASRPSPAPSAGEGL